MKFAIIYATFILVMQYMILKMQNILVHSKDYIESNINLFHLYIIRW